MEQIIKNAVANTSKETIGCFVKDTKVRVEGENLFDYKKIQDIQVGDKVLAVPEDGIGEPAFKRVTNVFEFENKAIWYVGIFNIGTPALTDAEIAEDDFYCTTPYYFGVTPNHPFLVIGTAYQTHADDALIGPPKDLALYDKPIWKRADQLSFGDVLTTPTGRRFCIRLSKPLHKHAAGDSKAWLNSAHEWVQTVMPGYRDIDLREGILYDMDDIDDGQFQYEEFGCLNLDMMLGDTHEEGYQPYTTRVYNIEVEDYHTYAVGDAGIIVHNTNCGEDVLVNKVAPEKMQGKSYADLDTAVFNSKKGLHNAVTNESGELVKE